MNFIRNNVANAFTLGNLFSGCIGAVHLLNGDYRTTALCIAVSLILDFFDGFVARAMKSNSELGVQLDSLADMVSFGLLPGLVMYKMLEACGDTPFGYVLPFDLKYAGFFVTLFSCLRLAIFNLDDEQNYYFKGLNTPSNTIFLFGLFYVWKETGIFGSWLSSPVCLLLLSVISSWLLVSPIRMIAMKFKSKKLRDNHPKVALFTGSVLILALFKTVGIPLIIVWYLLVSLLFQKSLK